MKNCPYCDEEIQDEAIKCKFCGEWLNKEDETNINSEEEKLVVKKTSFFSRYYKLLGRLIFIGFIIIFSFFGGKEDKIYNEAKKAFSEKNYDLALNKYDELLKEYPNNYMGYNDKSLILHEKKKYKEALNEINKIDISNISSKQIYLISSIESNKCLYYQSLKESVEAEKHCDTALSYFNKNALALNNKAIILESKGKYNDALNLINKSIEYWDLPENKSEGYGDINGIDTLYNAKGLILSDLGEYEEGIRFLNKAINTNYNNFYAHSNKALILTKQGNNNEALNEIDIALSIEKNEGIMYEVKGYILSELEKYDDSIIYYDKALELIPNDFVTNYSKTLSLFYLGKYQEAYDLSEKVSNLSYTEGEKIYANENTGIKCLSLILLEKYEDGILECDKYLENYSNNTLEDLSSSEINVLVYKGLALANLGKTNEAIDVFNKVLEKDPNNETAKKALYGE